MVGALRTRALTEADLEEIAGSFVTAGHLAEEAGFDAVEIHLGHGGGPIENRMRFPVEVARRVVTAVGDRLAVLVKLNQNDGDAAHGKERLEPVPAPARRKDRVPLAALRGTPFSRAGAADPAARSKCMNCNQCVAEFARAGGVRCVLNPEKDPARYCTVSGSPTGPEVPVRPANSP